MLGATFLVAEMRSMDDEAGVTSLFVAGCGGAKINRYPSAASTRAQHLHNSPIPSPSPTTPNILSRWLWKQHTTTPSAYRPLRPN